MLALLFVAALAAPAGAIGPRQLQDTGGGKLEYNHFLVLGAKYFFPFLFLLIALGVFLHRSVRFCPSLFPCWLVGLGYPSISNNHTRIMWITRLFNFVLVLPLAVVLLWGAWVTWRFKPRLIGVAIGLLGFSIISTIFILGKLKYQRWRLTASTARLRALTLLALLVFVMASLFLSQPFEYVGISVIFMAFNMLPMCVIYHRFVSGHKLTFLEYYNAQNEVGRQQVAEEKLDYNKSKMIALYFYAVLVLIIYSFVVWIFAVEQTPVGFVTLFATLALDVCAMMMVWINNQQNPSVLALVFAAARAALVFVGVDFFFFGHCAIYALMTISCAVQLIDSRLPHSYAFLKNENLHSILRDLRQHEQLVEVAPRLWDRVRARLKSYQSLILLMTILFLFDILAVALLDVQPRITRYGSHKYPQFIFGFPTLSLTFLLACALATLRLYRLHNFSVRRSVAVGVILCELTSIATGLFFFFVTDSTLALLLFALLPVAFSSGYHAWNVWMLQDFVFFPGAVGPGSEVPQFWSRALQQRQQQTQKHRAELHRQFTETHLPDAPFSPRPVASVNILRAPSHHQLIAEHSSRKFHPANLLVAGGVFYLCLLLIGIFGYYFVEPNYVGWSISFVIAISVTTILPFAQWFNSFEVSRFMWVAGFVNVLLLALFGGFMGRTVPTTQRRVGFGLGLFIYTFFVFLVAGIYKWRDDGWKLRRSSFLLMSVSLSALCAIVVVVIFVSDVFWGLALLGGVVLTGAAVVVMYIYIRNGYYLPRKALFFSVGVLVATALLGVAYGEVTNNSFLGLSVAWGCVLIASLLYTVHQFLSHKHGQLHFSWAVVPAFRWDAKSHSLQNAVAIVFSGYMTLLILVWWGIATAIFIEPAWLGLSVTSLTLVLFFIYTTALLNHNSLQFALLQDIIEQNPAIMSQCLRRAEEDQLGRHDQLLNSRIEMTYHSTQTPMQDDDLGPLPLPEKLHELMEQLHSLRHSLSQKQTWVTKEGKTLSVSESYTHLLTLSHTCAAAFTDQNRFLAEFELLVIFRAKSLLAENDAMMLKFLRSAPFFHSLSRQAIRNMPESTRKMIESAILEFLDQKRKEKELLARLKLESEEGERKRRENLDKRVKAEIAKKEKEKKEKAEKEQKEPEKKVTETSKDPPLSSSLHKKEEMALSGFDRSEVDAIIAECEKTGVQWCDADFECGMSALALDTRSPPEFASGVTQWLRVSQISHSPALFSSMVKASDVQQGRIGNCWLLSALTVLSTRPELLKKLFLNQEINRWGVYGVQLHLNGRWTQVIVDDRLPCDASGCLVFGRSANMNEFWVSILEKAYAKTYGSYEALEGGLVHLALVDLTGGAAEEIKLDSAQGLQDVASGSLWHTLSLAHSHGYLMGAGSAAGGQVAAVSSSERSIVRGHAYAILDLRHVDGLHMIKLKNPWGSGFEDVSAEKWMGWSRRLRAKLEHTLEDDRNNGIFWLALADFVSHFSSVFVCRIYSDSESSSSQSIVKTRIESEWKGVTAGGSPNNTETAQNNPQWFLWVGQPTDVFFVLSQTDKRGSGTPLAYISLLILKKKGKRVKCVYKGEKVASSGNYINRREVSGQTKLMPSSHPYTIFPSTFTPGEETAFSITFYSDMPVRVEPVPLDVPAE